MAVRHHAVVRRLLDGWFVWFSQSSDDERCTKLLGRPWRPENQYPVKIDNERLLGWQVTTHELERILISVLPAEAEIDFNLDQEVTEDP